MSTLADYLADTRRLLRAKGSSTVVYDDADLTAFINRAKNQTDQLNNVQLDNEFGLLLSQAMPLMIISS